MTEFYYTFSKGSDWITLRGEGRTPLNCANVRWETSPQNGDLADVKDAQSAFHPVYNIVDLNKNKNNLYIQVMRATRLIRLGYRFKESNFPDIKEVL